jgi:hypothetical protein
LFLKTQWLWLLNQIFGSAVKSLKAKSVRFLPQFLIEDWYSLAFVRKDKRPFDYRLFRAIKLKGMEVKKASVAETCSKKKAG